MSSTFHDSLLHSLENGTFEMISRTREGMFIRMILDAEGEVIGAHPIVE